MLAKVGTLSVGVAATIFIGAAAREGTASTRTKISILLRVSDSEVTSGRVEVRVDGLHASRTRGLKGEGGVLLLVPGAHVSCTVEEILRLGIQADAVCDFSGESRENCVLHMWGCFKKSYFCSFKLILMNCQES